MIALKTGGTSRISVPERYKRNLLEWFKEAEGQAAMEAAVVRLREGHQVHHLIPDAVAQEHL